MNSQNHQSATIAFLAKLQTRGAGATIERIETHISIVFLTDARAFKLKRAVKLPYLDFTTPERRLAACEQEVLLNRRTAPTLYLAVRRITRETDGGLTFDGTGELVDAVVEMRRFDQDGLLDAMARTGRLTAPLMTTLSKHIADFHSSAEVVTERRGTDRISRVLSLNELALAASPPFSADEVADLNGRFRSELARHAQLLDARERGGKVRRCHGDLHLRNICVIDGQPTLFDCLEFDEELATTDILYDLAFLLMDLWHRDLHALANLVFNRYLDETLDHGGLALVPFFMALRAAVRAHVCAQAIANAKPRESDGSTGSQQAQSAEAREYFELARRLLTTVKPHLVAIGGFSGSGKSSIAAAVAPDIGPAPGARVLSSDRIRKRLHGVAPETRLSEDAYRANASSQVYSVQRREAESALTAGHGVIADAVFDRPMDRERIAAVARMTGVSFCGLWLDVDVETLVKRIALRKCDPSDATEAVVRKQIGRNPEPIGWMRIDARCDPDKVAQVARSTIMIACHGARAQGW